MTENKKSFKAEKKLRMFIKQRWLNLAFWMSSNKRTICRWLGKGIIVIAKIIIEKVLAHYIKF